MSITNRLVLSQRYAEQLRERSTAAERELCRLLDDEKISYVFQSNICDIGTGKVYIADFRIRRIRQGRPNGMPRKEWRRLHVRTQKLFIELDGSFHDGRQIYDATRTRWIETHRDAIVLRFTNADVFHRPGDVIAKIVQYQPARKTVKTSYTSHWRRP